MGEYLTPKWYNRANEMATPLEDWYEEALNWPTCAIGEACRLDEIPRTVCEGHQHQHMNVVMSAQHPDLREYGAQFAQDVCDGKRDAAMAMMVKINEYCQAHGAPAKIRDDIAQYVDQCRILLNYKRCTDCNPPKAD